MNDPVTLLSDASQASPLTALVVGLAFLLANIVAVWRSVTSAKQAESAATGPIREGSDFEKDLQRRLDEAMEHERAGAQRERNLLSGHIGDLRREVSELHGAIDEMRRQHSADRTEWHEKLAAKDREIASLTAANRALQSENLLLKKQARQLQRDVSSLERRVEALDGTARHQSLTPTPPNEQLTNIADALDQSGARLEDSSDD